MNQAFNHRQDLWNRVFCPAYDVIIETLVVLDCRVIVLRSEKLIVRLIPFGARVISIEAPDRIGLMENIVVSPPSIEEFSSAAYQYHGAAIGRYANRIANGRYEFEGISYPLEANEPPNILHGGAQGFHMVDWKIEEVNDKRCVFIYLSKDGEEGFPGNLKVRLVYELRHTNELALTFTAVTDKTTPVNFTHHCFFNLTGDSNKSIDNHFLQIKADAYLPIHPNGIPIGTQEAVSESPFDFNSLRKLNSSRLSSRQLEMKGGYDHTYVLSPIRAGDTVARLEEQASGRYMEIITSEPGMQLYTGRHLTQKSNAICLEPQHYPDSPNHPSFPDTFLKPGQEYISTTRFLFCQLK